MNLGRLPYVASDQEPGARFASMDFYKMEAHVDAVLVALSQEFDGILEHQLLGGSGFPMMPKRDEAVGRCGVIENMCPSVSWLVHPRVPKDLDLQTSLKEGEGVQMAEMGDLYPSSRIGIDYESSNNWLNFTQ